MESLESLEYIKKLTDLLIKRRASFAFNPDSDFPDQLLPVPILFKSQEVSQIHIEDLSLPPQNHTPSPQPILPPTKNSSKFYENPLKIN